VNIVLEHNIHHPNNVLFQRECDISIKDNLSSKELAIAHALKKTSSKSFASSSHL
jgi:hypothetical protein